MNKSLTALSLVVAGAISLHGSLATAQTWNPSQEVQVYGGEIFGDRLTETPISGSTPRANDSATVGGRYNYNFNDTFGVQLSAGFTPGFAAHVASGNSDLNITTVDLDAVWNILPDFRFYGHKIVPYTVIGVGYAWADLNHSITGTVAGRQVLVTDSNGYTANAGLGAKYFVTDNLFVDFNGRYRYFSKLVNNFGQGMNTAETSLGVGWRF
jgi:opacity protein-like surface antigen